ncbi:hemerythrin domain-containing protein [Streptomyces sp. NPDC046876]|uniref:hemerythrin domain-containing protein n=1 Tax=Streptomyces sp. NPDC046876 TaxID=3155616 RepID=UPI0033E431DF
MDSEHHTTPARHHLPAVPDLTGIRLAHRAILTDIDRLARLLDGLATAADEVSPARAAAIAAYVHRYNEVVRGHHRGEDEILWPVVLDAVADAAEAVADIVRFVDDHEALDALQADCDETADRFAAEPGRHARPLADVLARQRDLLVDHIEAEEEHLFPVITGQVPGAAYAAAEAGIRSADRAADPAWARGWLLSHATPTELRRLLPPCPADDPVGGIQPLLRAYAADASTVFPTA